MHTRIATTHGATPMSRPTRDTRTALDAYMGHHAAALALLARIHDAIADHDVSADPETVNWGHVGDIAETRKALQEISDRLFSEGEYAEVACLRCPATFGSSGELEAHYRTAH